jgi:hypothetical protein
MYQPFVKFITFTTSYVILVFLVLYSSLHFPMDEVNRVQFSVEYPEFYENFTVYTSNSNLTYYFPVNDFFIRRNTPSMPDIILCIWLIGIYIIFRFLFANIFNDILIIGLIGNEIKLIFRYGFKEYFYSWSNMFNVSMYILFVSSFSLKFYTMILIRIEINKLSDPAFWSNVNSLSKVNDLNTEIDVFQVFYWLNDGNFNFNI